MTALAVVASVALVVGGALQALRMVLAHQAKRIEHAPIAKLEAQLAELEQRLVSSAMRR